MLSTSSACSARRLSPSRLNASLALSENLLTRVKRKNCAKRNVKVSEPFLKPGIAERKERALNSCERTLNSSKSLKSEINRGKEQSKKPSFDLLGRFVSF